MEFKSLDEVIEEEQARQPQKLGAKGVLRAIGAGIAASRGASFSPNRIIGKILFDIQNGETYVENGVIGLDNENLDLLGEFKADIYLTLAKINPEKIKLRPAEIYLSDKRLVVTERISESTGAKTSLLNKLLKVSNRKRSIWFNSKVGEFARVYSNKVKVESSRLKGGLYFNIFANNSSVDYMNPSIVQKIGIYASDSEINDLADRINNKITYAISNEPLSEEQYYDAFLRKNYPKSE